MTYSKDPEVRIALLRNCSGRWFAWKSRPADTSLSPQPEERAEGGEGARLERSRGRAGVGLGWTRGAGAGLPLRVSEACPASTLVGAPGAGTTGFVQTWEPSLD